MPVVARTPATAARPAGLRPAGSGAYSTASRSALTAASMTVFEPEKQTVAVAELRPRKEPMNGNGKTVALSDEQKEAVIDAVEAIDWVTAAVELRAVEEFLWNFMDIAGSA